MNDYEMRIGRLETERDHYKAEVEWLREVMELQNDIIAGRKENTPVPDDRNIISSPIELLTRYATCLATVPGWNAMGLECATKEVVAEKGIRSNQLIFPLRYALTGKDVGCGIYDTMAILGKDSCLARIDRAIAMCFFGFLKEVRDA